MVKRIKIKLVVEIPSSRFCDHCFYNYEQVESFQCEMSHDHCALIDKQLSHDSDHLKRTKKHPDCPVYKEAQR